MAQVINTNIASLTAQRNLATSQKDAASAMQRLSSGLRINSAKDDAAGMAIASRLTAQINGINQAVRNANDGISVAQVAEGALSETSDILQRIRQLAVQSANASNSSADRSALQLEVAELTSEIDRIARNTSFGDVKLLNGTYTNQKFQVGANNGETMTLSVASAKAEDLGTVNSLSYANFLTARTSAEATSSTNSSEIAAHNLTFAVSGNSTVVAVAADASAETIAANVTAQVDGVNATAATIMKIANGGATFEADAGDSVTVTLNGETLAGLAYTSQAAFNVALKAAIDANANLSDLSTTLLSSDAVLEIANTTGADITFGIVEVDNDATTNADIDLDISSLPSSGGTADATYGTEVDVTTAGFVTVTGHISFTAESSTDSYSVTSSVALGSGGTGSTSAESGTVTASATRVDDLDISTVSGANTALDVLDAAIREIDSQRASIGAIQSRLDSVVSNLMNVSENSSAAKSRIVDADFAAETAALAKNQILQQAGISVLAQANAQPQNVLALLQ